MTQDEIIEMARQAGVYSGANEMVFSASLKAFAKLVAEREREACAFIVEENAKKCGVDTVAWMILASNAQAIRARRQA
jgi:hypothetical protein